MQLLRYMHAEEEEEKKKEVVLGTATETWCCSLAYYQPLPAAVVQCIMCDTVLSTTVFLHKNQCLQDRKLLSKLT